MNRHAKATPPVRLTPRGRIAAFIAIATLIVGALVVGFTTTFVWYGAR